MHSGSHSWSLVTDNALVDTLPSFVAKEDRLIVLALWYFFIARTKTMGCKCWLPPPPLLATLATHVLQYSLSNESTRDQCTTFAAALDYLTALTLEGTHEKENHEATVKSYLPLLLPPMQTVMRMRMTAPTMSLSTSTSLQEVCPQEWMNVQGALCRTLRTMLLTSSLCRQMLDVDNYVHVLSGFLTYVCPMGRITLPHVF